MRISKSVVCVVVMGIFVSISGATLAQTAKEWDSKGYDYKMEGNYEKALECYTKAIEVDPTYVWAYDGRGDLYRLNLKDYEKAVEDYTTCIKIGSDNSSWYLFRGNSYYSMGKLRKAIADYTKGLEIDPDQTWFYDNRGSAYNDLGKYKKALRDANTAVEQSPNYYLGYLVRGKAYEGLGRVREARKDFEKACDLGSMEACNKFGGESAEAWFSVGENYRYNDDYKNAIDCFTRTIELNPEHKYAYNWRGKTYYLMGKYNEALADYTKGISNDPTNQNTYYDRGMVLLKLGRKKEALKDFKKACDMDSLRGCDRLKELGN